MLMSPKWQTMWMESQYCSKGVFSVPLNSQQTKKIFEDVKENCNSPNKSVQLEALKCWGTWINSQNPNDWKMNTLCYTAIRPLITKKLQPLHKDVDVCKLKLSLMWSLILKVENIMYLEGPQYILEVFLQSCLTWLSSTDTIDNETSILIFQLVLALFKKDEDLKDCDREMFPPLSVEILSQKKVFQSFADKILNIFINWKKVKDKSTVLKIWKYYLEHYEHSCESIPTPIWYRIFKIIGQICSESTESVKHRLAFLHSCATSLKTVLCSSKFIDFGNVLTPCEALLKKLMELCQIPIEEFCDSEMFFLSQEICQVLTEESVALGGYDLCISILDLMEEFSLRSLFWGVWCGLVHCYEVHVMGVGKNNLTKIQNKFYRKLRGVAVNYDLDKDYLHKDCTGEVEKHIEVLNIKCFCACVSENQKNSENVTDLEMEIEDSVLKEIDSEKQDENFVSKNEIVPVIPKNNYQAHISVPCKNLTLRIVPQIISLRYDLLKGILKSTNVYSVKDLVEGLFLFRFPNGNELNRYVTTNLQINLSMADKKITLTDFNSNKPLAICDVSPKKSEKVSRRRSKINNNNEALVSTPKTRSRKKAEEEEEIKKEMEEKNGSENELVKEGNISKKEKEGSKIKLLKDGSKPDLEKGGKNRLVKDVSKNDFEKEDGKNKLLKNGSKNDLEKEGNKNKLVKDGIKSDLEKEGGKNKLIKDGSKNDLEKEGSKNKLLKVGSKNNMEKEGNKIKLFKVGSKNDMEKEGNKNKLVKDGSKPDVEKDGNKNKLLKVGSKPDLEKEGGKNRLIKDISKNDLEKEGSKNKLVKDSSKNDFEKDGSKNKLVKDVRKPDLMKEGGKNKLLKVGSKNDLVKEGSKNVIKDNQKKRKKKTFEVIVQEIVWKNKLRKTEKSKETEKRKLQKQDEKENTEVFKRRLRNSKEAVKSGKKKDGKPTKTTNGKLENYFKVISKKTVNEKENPPPPTKPETEKNAIKKKKKKRMGKIKATQRLRKEKAQLSPFKEVSHDHEYARVKPSKTVALGQVFAENSLKKQEKKVKVLCEVNQSETLNKIEGEVTKEKLPLSTPQDGTDLEVEPLLCSKHEESALDVNPAVDMLEVKEEVELDLLEAQVNEDAVEEEVVEKMDVDVSPLEVEKSKLDSTEPTCDVPTPEVEKSKLDGTESNKKMDTEAQTELNVSETKMNSENIKDVASIFVTSTPVTRGEKRPRIMDSLKPSKRIKLDISESIYPVIDVLEKENVENRLEEVKVNEEITTTEVTEVATMEGLAGDKIVSILKVRDDTSLKSLNGSVSSRALRMIALIPESTKSSPVQRESSHKVENMKLKKAPNVDKSSRASKMLALLSENTIKDEDDLAVLDEEKTEDILCNGSKHQITTPNANSPISTPKSFSSLKKRRLIRFDDAKNETILYKTDTPPSQILEEKEKFRRRNLANSCLDDSLN